MSNGHGRGHFDERPASAYTRWEQGALLLYTIHSMYHTHFERILIPWVGDPWRCPIKQISCDNHDQTIDCNVHVWQSTVVDPHEHQRLTQKCIA